MNKERISHFNNLNDKKNKNKNSKKEESERDLDKFLLREKRKKKEREIRRKTIKKPKYKKIKANNFSIIINNEENKNKIFKNELLIPETAVQHINFMKKGQYTNLNYFKVNEYNFILDKNIYLKSKTKDYIIDNCKEEQIIFKPKIKYDESELVICSKVINIILKRNKIKKDIPVNKLKFSKKIKTDKASDGDKVKKIIEKIKNENIINKIIKGKNQSLYNINFCANCYESFNIIEVTNHKNHLIIELKDFKVDEDELDYNIKLNIIYEILKKCQKVIIKEKNYNIIKYYRKLLIDLYEIIINDNSIEELNSSIIIINEVFFKYNKIGIFTDNLKDLFLLFIQTISQYAYLKGEELSLNEGDNYSFNNDELDKEDILENDLLLEDDKNKYNDEDKKKYFFKLGLDLKFKNKNNLSLNDLYSKAQENKIEINEYNNFLIKELNIN